MRRPLCKQLGRKLDETRMRRGRVVRTRTSGALAAVLGLALVAATHETAPRADVPSPAPSAPTVPSSEPAPDRSPAVSTTRRFVASNLHALTAAWGEDAEPRSTLWFRGTGPDGHALELDGLGRLLGQLQALFGNPAHTDADGFAYIIRDSRAGVVFMLSLDDEFRLSVEFGPNVETRRTGEIVHDLDELLASTTPADCETTYRNAYGEFRFGVKAGKAFGFEVRP